MTDAPFTETHRATLLWMGGILAHRGQRDASNAAIKEIERLTLLVQACGNTECIAKAKYDATLRQMKLYGRELDDWAEKEASCCPEDVSFVDRIKWLEGEIDRLYAIQNNLSDELDRVRLERDGFQHTLRQANIQIDRLTAENEQLRKHLDGLYQIAHPEDSEAR